MRQQGSLIRWSLALIGAVTIFSVPALLADKLDVSAASEFEIQGLAPVNQLQFVPDDSNEEDATAIKQLAHLIFNSDLSNGETVQSLVREADNAGYSDVGNLLLAIVEAGGASTKLMSSVNELVNFHLASHNLGPIDGSSPSEPNPPAEGGVAATTLLSPTGDGGFENGATFADNGWTVVNHNAHTWHVGGVAVPDAGANSAYVSNDGGTTYAYTNTVSNTSHFYRDITVPAGESNIAISFRLKVNGESGFDRLLLYTAPTSVTPVAGTPASSSTTLAGATLVFTGAPISGGTAYGTVSGSLSPTLAGTTFRLIFTWQNDGSFGSNPPASVDSISIVSDMPPPYDECEAPIAIGALPFSTTIDVSGATADTTPVPPACGFSGAVAKSVWYSVVGTGSILRINTCIPTATDTRVRVYCGSCASLTCINGNDDVGTTPLTLETPSCALASGFPSVVQFCSKAGETYLIEVGLFSTATANQVINFSVEDLGKPCTATIQCGAGVCGNGDLGSTEGCDDGNVMAGDGCSATCVPENELCASSRIMPSALPWDVVVSTTAAAADPNPPNPVGSCNTTTTTTNRALWYAWTPSVTTCAKATCAQWSPFTQTSSHNSIMTVWTGTCPSVTQVACANATTSTASHVIETASWNAIGGTTYYIQIGTAGTSTVGARPTLRVEAVTATGRCCIGGVCSVLTACACAAGGGVYGGDGSTCAGGGCCNPAAGSCTITDPCACAAPATFLGVGSVCDLTTCSFNDNCVDREFVFDGDTPFNRAQATTDGSAHPLPPCDFPFGDDQLHRDVWFNYIATCTGRLFADTCEGAAFDTRIAIYDGCVCPPFANPIGCNDDSGGGGADAPGSSPPGDPDLCNQLGASPFESATAIQVVQGNCYKIRIGGFSDTSPRAGIDILHLECEAKGGCCLADHTCVAGGILAECDALGGMFHPGQACDGFHACCFPNGSCEDIDPLCCTGAGGVPHLGQSCEGDVDMDGTDGECGDLCPDDPNKLAPGLCGCGVPDTDTDGDGTPDCNDLCPLDPNKTDPGICGCGVPDNDTDGDGTADCLDGCPMDPNKIAPGICGCGVSDVDTDGDGTADCLDGCPMDPNKIAPGICGCGVSDVDTDGDGTADCLDGCPNDPNKTAPGICGCGVADTDSDGDGTPNCNDGCPNDPNKTSPGACGCGVSDVDSDTDGVPNCNDGCPNDPNKTSPGVCGCNVSDVDSDGDGTSDCIDGCADDPDKIDPGVCGCGSPDTDTDGDGTPDCNEIPTVSEWGLIIMALLLITIGKVYFGRRETAVS